jgi:hypothetical protein
MERKRILSLVSLFLILSGSSILTNGCGNAKKEAGAAGATIPTTQAATVGMNVCTNCHAGQTAQWMKGQHANFESIDPNTFTIVDNGMNNTGVPYYGFEGLGTDPNCTLVCHDQLGDGQRLTPELTGNVPRPVIGCESCHGGGQQHYGIGPIPYPAPDHNRCGQCHNSSFPANHLTYHPNGANIVESFVTSSHGNSIESPNYVSGSTTDVEALCSRCHTDEGFKAYRLDAPGTLGYPDFIAAMDGKANIANASTVECRTCHNPHEASATDLTRVASSGSGTTAQSSAFNTCTSCHQTADGFHGEHSTFSYSGGVFDGGRIIYDTHFYPMSFSGTASAPTVSQLKSYPTYLDLTNDPTIAYNAGMKKKADVESCTGSCHNPHSADLTINRQWKAGAHGDPLKPSVDHTFSQVCVRCHLSTGFANLWSSGTASISTWIKTLSTNTVIPANYQGQLKTCNACHNGTYFPTAQNKQLRKTGTIELVAEGGAFTGTFDTSSKPVYTVETVAVTPDMGESATCLTCHQGREAGDSVRANIDALASAVTPTEQNNAKLKFINEHYLAAGATLFGGNGHKAFEYIDGNGATGLASSPNTTNNIPVQTYAPTHPHATGVGCVGCHMQNTGLVDLGGHSFMMDNGTAINNGICATCHSGGIPDFDTYRLPSNTLDYDGDGVVEGIHGEIEGLKTELIQLLAVNGIYYNPDVYPYFHSVSTKSGQSSGTAYSAWTQSQLKAAFNLNTFYKEPGAFTHNGKYAAEILIDAIADLSGGPDPSTGTPSYVLPAVNSGDYVFTGVTIYPQRP